MGIDVFNLKIVIFRFLLEVNTHIDQNEAVNLPLKLLRSKSQPSK